MPAPMILGKEKIIPIIAMSLLLIGTGSAIYAYESQTDSKSITIDGNQYSLEQIFGLGNLKTVDTDNGKKTGVSLEDLIYSLGINCPDCNMYTIKGSDRYQQTVTWDILKTGILTEFRQVFYPKTAHYLWIKDVIEIEVN